MFPEQDALRTVSELRVNCLRSWKMAMKISSCLIRSPNSICSHKQIVDKDIAESKTMDLKKINNLFCSVYVESFIIIDLKALFTWWPY